jgi:hypothetical protein
VNKPRRPKQDKRSDTAGRRAHADVSDQPARTRPQRTASRVGLRLLSQVPDLRATNDEHKQSGHGCLFQSQAPARRAGPGPCGCALRACRLPTSSRPAMCARWLSTDPHAGLDKFLRPTRQRRDRGHSVRPANGSSTLCHLWCFRVARRSGTVDQPVERHARAAGPCLTGCLDSRSIIDIDPHAYERVDAEGSWVDGRRDRSARRDRDARPSRVRSAADLGGLQGLQNHRMIAETPWPVRRYLPDRVWPQGHRCRCGGRGHRLGRRRRPPAVGRAGSTAAETSWTTRRMPHSTAPVTAPASPASSSPPHRVRASISSASHRVCAFCRYG